MSYPSSLSDYWHSVQWSSLTSSIPTDPRACLTSISASSFCCLPYLPFWPFSYFSEYNDLEVDDEISTSTSTWQPPPSALNSFSSSSSSSSLLASSSSSSFPTSVSSSSALRASQPIAQPVFSSHLASSTFSSPDQLSSILVRQQDELDNSSRRHKGADKDRKRKEDDRAARAMSGDMRKSRDSERSPSSQKHSHRHSHKSKSSKQAALKDKAADKDRTKRNEKKDKSRPASASRSSLSSSPTPLSHTIHQDEDMSDSELSNLSSSDDEQLLSVDRHERALLGSVGKPAAIY